MTVPVEPRIEDATKGDLELAINAVGHKAQYGGLLSCALAGIYAERQRTHGHVAHAISGGTTIYVGSGAPGREVTDWVPITTDVPAFVYQALALARTDEGSVTAIRVAYRDGSYIEYRRDIP